MPFPKGVYNKEEVKEKWKQSDFTKHVENLWETLQSPGVEKDGIPPLDSPHFVQANEAAFENEEAMIVVSIKEHAKAYRVDDVMLHEIVNDTIADVPIAITFCPLCNSAIVYKRVYKGKTIRLGVSGMLRHNDLIMWDDETYSWWQQFTGEAIMGEATGSALDVIPSQLKSFSFVQKQFPNSYVLQKTEQDPIPPSHQTGDFKKRGPKMVNTEKVFATIVHNQPIAISFHKAKQEKIVEVETEKEGLVIMFNDQMKEMGIEPVGMRGQASIFKRQVDKFNLHFMINEEGEIVDLETKSFWNRDGFCIKGYLQGKKLEALPCYPHFQEPWLQFHPDGILFKV
ncbi:DUF3179 domain-containing (seleno)protein [Pontibacillus salicampi]|uniref:DUF3179 domain-containing (Seleno)protein n=1 Tax=Pontibacillus salicampi TaxID=1449801 RepID=A0ABV6LR46_9BACI